MVYLYSWGTRRAKPFMIVESEPIRAGFKFSHGKNKDGSNLTHLNVKSI